MGLGDHVNLQLKRGVKIITCDPPKRLIEAETRNGEVITINAYSYNPTFRWPISGEKWVVGEENGSWFLEGIYEEQNAPTGEDVQPGDTVISAGSGNVWKNVDGQLEPLTSSQLSVSDYIENTAAAGFVLAEKEEFGPEKNNQFKIPESASARFILITFGIKGVENFGEVVLNGKHIAITERSGSVGTLYRTTLTVVLPPGKPCSIVGTASGEQPSGHARVIIQRLWESIS